MYKYLCQIFPVEIVHVILFEFSTIPISKDQVRLYMTDVLKQMQRTFLHNELMEYFK